MGPEKPADVTEQKRLNDARDAGIPWKKWGPYLSERQWGTVREDYSEEEMRGITSPMTSLAPVRTNGARTGLEESPMTSSSCASPSRYGTNEIHPEGTPVRAHKQQGNHGEDVKEYYFYIDSTPTHSYMKFLYKYPQREFPYRDLVETNGRRSREEFEYELLDTGIFDDDRYFDVFVEYAKAGPEDILIRITVHNRGPEKARLRCCQRSGFGTRGHGVNRRQTLATADSAGRDPGISPGVGR